MSDCNICAEKYNKTKRIKVLCSCGFESCRSCAKEYILDKMKNNMEDAHCMSCKVQWTRKFLFDNFEKNFMYGEYKIHYENLLVEKELSLLQATQPFVECEVQIEEIRSKLNDIDLEYKQIEKEYNLKKTKNIEEKHRMRTELENTMHKFNSTKAREFIRNCPNSTCHGFLDKTYQCKLCELYSCENCHELVGSMGDKKKHVCDKNILESVKLLENDSKPCPKCASMIFKINGCDQIFCVECHTAWNWKTGSLITNNIHNPHYFEYLAERNRGHTPRNTLDVLCGREVDEHFVMGLLNTLDIQNNVEFIICESARSVMHIRFIEIPKFQDEHHDKYCRQLRINYMRNKINKEDFKYLIQKKNKDFRKKKEIFDILIMYVNCMTDIFYIMLNNKKYNDTLDEIRFLRDYTNDCLEEVCRAYNCKKYMINDDFEFI